MKKILMTGMCSTADRCVSSSDVNAVYYTAQPTQPKTLPDLLEAFRLAANTGNYLITEGAHVALCHNDVRYIPFWHIANQPDPAEFHSWVAENFDAIAFITANILNEDFDLKAESFFISSAKIPVVIMSIGVQSKLSLLQGSTPNVDRFVSALKQADAFCFTRGSDGAAFLRSRGVRNVFEACCPSAFTFPENTIRGAKKILELEFETLDEVLLNGYLEHPRQTIDELKAFSPYTRHFGFVLQDEPLIFNVLSDLPRDVSIYDDASCTVHWPEREMVDGNNQLRVSYFAFFEPRQWRMRCTTTSLSLGRRFHGNLVALQAGTAAIFIAHDDRVREMLRSLSLPSIEPEAWSGSNNKLALLNNFQRGFEFAAFEERYCSQYELFTSQLRALLA